MRRILRTPTLWILLVAGALLLAISLANQAPPPDELTFSEFQSALAAGKVNDAKFLEASHMIIGSLTDGGTCSTHYPGESQDEIVDLAAEGGRGHRLRSAERSTTSC